MSEQADNATANERERGKIESGWQIIRGLILLRYSTNSFLNRTLMETFVCELSDFRTLTFYFIFLRGEPTPSVIEKK